MIKSSCLGRLSCVIAFIVLSTTLVLAQASNSKGSEEAAKSESSRMLMRTVTCAASVGCSYASGSYVNDSRSSASPRLPALAWIISLRSRTATSLG
jgi:hypothetical protein